MKAETATVYRAGGRRWFTKKGAARAEARALYRNRHPCECELPSGFGAGSYPGYVCEYHGERQEKFVSRVARLILRAGK